MNRDSRPEEFTPPTYEEVAEYARENNMIAKIDVKRFYEYYGRANFMYRGMPMDWQGKMRQWAETERKAPNKVVTAKEYANRKTNQTAGMSVADIWASVERI